MSPKSAERNRLSQRNSQSCCTTYVLEDPMQIDLRQQPHFPHFRSRQLVQSHQVYPRRMSLPSMRHLRVLRHRSPQCIVYLRQNIEIPFQPLGIKGIRPIIPMTTLRSCTTITKAVQAIASILHPLKVLFYLRFLAFNRWLLPSPRTTYPPCVTNLASKIISG
jgi:hypothetical protein